MLLIPPPNSVSDSMDMLGKVNDSVKSRNVALQSDELVGLKELAM